MIDSGKLGGEWQQCQCCQGASQVGTFLRNLDYRVANSREFPCGNGVNPFSAKPVFGRKKKKKFLGNFIAALVFMLER